MTQTLTPPGSLSVPTPPKKANGSHGDQGPKNIKRDKRTERVSGQLNIHSVEVKEDQADTAERGDNATSEGPGKC